MFQELTKQVKNNIKPIAITAVAVVGLTTVLITSAATSFFSLETEQSSQANVAQISDINASGSAAIQFGPSGNSGWNLYWSDEFDGDNVDLSRWGVYHNTYGDGNKEEACLTPNNVSVRGGSLKISAKREQITCPGNKAEDFSSGFVASRSIGSSGSNSTAQGIYYPAFARYEIRAKIPHGQGLWPAFWLRHRDGASRAEIDVMEYFHSQVPGKTSQTLHFPIEIDDNVAKKATNFEAPTTDPSWHTWSVEIVPTNQEQTQAKIILYADGVKTFEYIPTSFGWLNNYDKSAMFDIALNMAIGGNYVGHPDDELGWSRYLNQCLKPYGGSKPCDGNGIWRAQFPSAYEIDYVRVYSYGGSGSGGGGGTTLPPAGSTLATPSSISATAISGSVTLDWEDIPGADSYTVRWGAEGAWTNYSNDQGSSNNPTSSNYTVTGLTNGTTYNFAIAARDTTGTYVKGPYSSLVAARPS